MSYIGTEIFRKWATKKGKLDIPNQRSSHAFPIPRGGGVIFVALSIASNGIAYLMGFPTLGWGFIAGGIVVSAVSWVDDLISVPFALRLIAHGLSAALLIADSGYWQTFSLPFISSTFVAGFSGLVVTFVWLVYMINAYNFMDGIDGIAGLQAVAAGIAWGIVALISGNHGMLVFCGVLAFSCLGFLIHNWSPAKIFMGDVGSAFLGYTFGAMPIVMAKQSQDLSSILPFVGLMFVWFFVFDTFVTLVKRLSRRKPVWNAHREHLYQRLIISGWTHRSVAILYGVLAAFTSISTLAGLTFSGKFWLMAVFSAMIFGFTLVFLSNRKKLIDVSV